MDIQAKSSYSRSQQRNQICNLMIKLRGHRVLRDPMTTDGKIQHGSMLPRGVNEIFRQP
jgi:hypothetical protein